MKHIAEQFLLFPEWEEEQPKYGPSKLFLDAKTQQDLDRHLEKYIEIKKDED